MSKDKLNPITAFLDFQNQNIKSGNFWEGGWVKENICNAILSGYHKEIIRKYNIVDFVVHGNEVMFKWHERFVPLTDEELKNKYKK